MNNVGFECWDITLRIQAALSLRVWVKPNCSSLCNFAARPRQCWVHLLWVCLAHWEGGRVGGQWHFQGEKWEIEHWTPRQGVILTGGNPSICNKNLQITGERESLNNFKLERFSYFNSTGTRFWEIKKDSTEHVSHFTVLKGRITKLSIMWCCI